MVFEFPTQPELLTTDWLTSMLRSAGLLNAKKEVREFSCRSIGDGVGMVGRVVRVDLEYQGCDSVAPPSLVMKFAQEIEERRAIGMRLRIYEREVTFYNDIAGSVKVPMPACYFAAVEKSTGECIVVLEDMRRYRQGDQLVGVGFDEAKQVIDAVAPLHAAYWGNTSHEYLRDAMRVDTTWREPHMEIVERTWRKCVTQFGYCIPAEVKESLAEYVRGIGPLHGIMGNRTQTLLHGDPRMDNLMFNQGDLGPPVVLLDWQALMISNPLHDLALLLSMSATIETRRSMENELVRYYHSKMTDLGVTGYSLEQCYDDYDLALLYLMSVALIMGGAFDPENDRGRRLSEAVLRRACTSVIDRRLLKRIPT